MGLQDRNDDSSYKNKIANLSDLFFNGSAPNTADKTEEVYFMSKTHGEVHKGNTFSSSNLFTGVADSGSVDTKIQTNSTNIHIIFLIRSTGQAEVEIYNGSTFTDNGTEIDSTNRKFPTDPPKTATAKTYINPTIDTLGTLQTEEFIPGESQRGNVVVGGEADLREEFIFSENTEPLLRVTNTSGQDNQKIFVKYIWYEN